MTPPTVSMELLPTLPTRRASPLSPGSLLPHSCGTRGSDLGGSCLTPVAAGLCVLPGCVGASAAARGWLGITVLLEITVSLQARKAINRHGGLLLPICC